MFFGRPIDDEKLYGKRLSEVLLEISKDTLKVLLNPLNLLTGIIFYHIVRRKNSTKKF